MKDFKNDNEYDNMKTEDEAYDGILLKTGDEGYRYYSEDDYSEDSSIADIIITCGYVSETSSTAKVNMSATCENADDLYIRLLKDEGTVLYSTGTSGTSFSTQKTFVSAGTYIVEAEVVRTNGGRKVRRAALNVETNTGADDNCSRCDETGWISYTTKCTNCGAGDSHAAPIQLGHYVVSESISTATINMTASCTNAVDMYLRVIREDGTECYSRHASSTNVSKTMPLGAGRYTLQAEAISLTGGIRIATNEMVINPGNSSSSGSSSGGCYNCGGTGYVGSYNCSICNPSTGSSGSSSNNCSNCGGTGYIGSQNCSICNPSSTNQGEISYTYSYEAISETTTKLTVNANYSTASSMYVEVYRSSSTSRYHSAGTSANHITTTATLGTGAYTVKIRAVCSSGNKETQFDVTLDGGSYDCSYCNDTGWYGNYLCTHCENGNSIEPIVINSATESVSSCLVKLSVSASCCEPTNKMYIYVYSAGTSNVKYSTMASSYHVEGEKELLFGAYEIEVLAYLGNGTVKTKRIPIELEVDEDFADSEVHPLPTYVIEHSENIYFNYGNNNYTVTINATCENADRVEVEVGNEEEPEISGASYRFVLNEGKYDVKIRAYVGNNVVKEEPSFEIELCKEELEITHLVNVHNVKSNGAYDVQFSTSCGSADNIYLWVHDIDNNNNLIYSASGSNCIFDTAELHPGNYNVVIKAVRYQNPCGYRHYEELLPLEKVETDTGGGSIGGDEDDTTPGVEDIPDNERKFVLLYTGPGYTDYANDSDWYDADEICKKILETGATDFVLTTAHALNKVNEDTTILSYEGTYTGDDKKEYVLPAGLAKVTDYFDSALFTTGVEDTYNVKLDNLEGQYELFKEQMKKDIVDSEKEFNQYKNTTYEIFMSSVISLAKKLVALNSNIGIWIAFPPMMSGCGAAATVYNTVYKTYIYDIAVENLKDCWDNVRGFYYAQEDIPYYLKYDSESKYFGNPVVENIAFMKNAIGNKKLLWIPYYSEYLTQINRNMSVINSGEYFDIAILQSSHYFDKNRTIPYNGKGLDWVDEEVKKNLNAESKSTVVGPEMELDGYICEMIYNRTHNKPTEDYDTIKARYYDYEARFENYVGECPIAYYADIYQQLVEIHDQNYLYTVDEMHDAMNEVVGIIKDFFAK